MTQSDAHRPPGRPFLWLAPYLLYLVLTVPFAGKCFHIDDGLFVKWARHLREHPSSPLSHRLEWLGRSTPIAQTSPNPPGQAYLLAGLIAAQGGEDETGLHLGLLPFGLLGLWATGALARRFGVSPLAAQLLVSASPALVLASHSLMPDLALFGLTAAGLAMAIRYIDDAGLWRGLCAGLLLGAAVLVRHNALAILLLVLIYPLLLRRSWRRAAVPLLVATAVIAPWALLLASQTGDGHAGAILNLGGARNWIHVRSNLLCVLAFIGGTTLLPPLLALPVLRRARARWLLLAAAAALYGVYWSLPREGPLPVRGAAAWWLLPILTLGGLALVGDGLQRTLALVRRWRSRVPAASDDVFLALWILGLALLPVLYLHVAAKYLIPALPAIVIFFLRAAQPIGKTLLVCATTGSALLAALLGVADRDLADIAPKVARELVAPNLLAGKRVWFTPEWGYPLYLEKAGAQKLHDGALPAPGDLVLTTDTTPPFDVLSRMKLHTTLRSSTTYGGRVPLVTMNLEQGAGFYSNHWGWLPFAVIAPSAPIERVHSREVVPTPATAAPVPR